MPRRYRIEDLLGEGGMGVVRACRDKHVGRTVAVKALRAGASAEQFIREARIQGQLEHPSIVPVYEIGTDQADAPWFTMRRVKGLTLGNIIDGLKAGDETMKARFPRRRLLTAFATVCLTIHYAHTRGVLHRDLKPDNIMLGEFGEVHVLDWGVARVVNGEDLDDPTERGAVDGTPGYLSPEQARAEPQDARTDVYALGAILFEILTLHQLVEGKSTNDLLAATLSRPVTRPSQRVPGAEIPPELDEICVRATAFDRARRHPTARDLGEAIERFLDGDRDLALRIRLAERHEASARRALADIGLPGERGLHARATAMRELTAAMALAPGRSAPAALMARLILEPPVETPAEVEAQLEDNMARERARGTRLLPIPAVAWLACAPLAVWMGMRSAGFVAFTIGLIVLYCATGLRFAARSRVSIAQAVVLLLMNCGVLSLFTAVFGPLVLAPTVALSTFAFYALLGGAPRLRLATAVAAMASFLVPLALELAGVLPPSTSFDGERLIVHARVVGFPPVASFTLLIIGTILSVGLSLLYIHRARGDMWRAERQLLVQAWHHRQVADRGHGARTGSF